MKRVLGVIAIMLLLVVGCSQSTADFEERIKQSMEETFNSDPAFSKYFLQVDGVVVVPKIPRTVPTGNSGNDPSTANQYTGIAIVHTPFGENRDVWIQVTADGDRIMWQAAPGSFLFLAQESPIGSTDTAVGTPTQSATPVPVGTPVRDGPLEFTVLGVRRAASVPTPAGQQQAAGEYLIVHLTVKNVGSQPQSYYTDSQSLVIAGTQHHADNLAAVYLDQVSDQESTDTINPGLAIDIETPFDVPVGSQPGAIVLRGGFNPGGVTVDLTGARISAG
jgi:hypothetical protein